MDIRKVIEECRVEIQAASEDGNEYDEPDGGKGGRAGVGGSWGEGNMTPTWC